MKIDWSVVLFTIVIVAAFLLGSAVGYWLDNGTISVLGGFAAALAASYGFFFLKRRHAERRVPRETPSPSP